MCAPASVAVMQMCQLQLRGMQRFRTPLQAPLTSFCRHGGRFDWGVFAQSSARRPRLPRMPRISLTSTGPKRLRRSACLSRASVPHCSAGELHSLRLGALVCVTQPRIVVARTRLHVLRRQGQRRWSWEVQPHGHRYLVIKRLIDLIAALVFAAFPACVVYF